MTNKENIAHYAQSLYYTNKLIRDDIQNKLYHSLQNAYTIYIDEPSHQKVHGKRNKNMKCVVIFFQNVN